MRFLAIFLFFAIGLSAHNLKIFTTKDGDFLHVKAYFSAKSPCMDCNVSVERFDKKKPFTCKTNNQGEAKIPLNINPTKVIVNAGLGHKNSIRIVPEIERKSTISATPFWVKIVLGLLSIFSFFAGMKWAKRR